MKVVILLVAAVLALCALALTSRRAEFLTPAPAVMECVYQNGVLTTRAPARTTTTQRPATQAPALRPVLTQRPATPVLIPTVRPATQAPALRPVLTQRPATPLINIQRPVTQAPTQRPATPLINIQRPVTQAPTLRPVLTQRPATPLINIQRPVTQAPTLRPVLTQRPATPLININTPIPVIGRNMITTQAPATVKLGSPGVGIPSGASTVAPAKRCLVWA